VADHSDKAFTIDFIDPLFAVAIHIGLTHGILDQAWFKEWRPPNGHEVFDVLVLGLGFWTVILSWVGYHESIKGKPLKGLGRFVVDVLLVGSYALLLVKFQDIDAVLELLVWIYLLFIVWDLFKVREYKDRYQAPTWSQRYRRELVTGGWFVAFLGLLVTRKALDLTPVATLVGMWVATTMYRVNKGVPMWSSLVSAIGRRVFGSN